MCGASPDLAPGLSRSYSRLRMTSLPGQGLGKASGWERNSPGAHFVHKHLVPLRLVRSAQAPRPQPRVPRPPLTPLVADPARLSSPALQQQVGCAVRGEQLLQPRQVSSVQGVLQRHVPAQQRRALRGLPGWAGPGPPNPAG